MTAAFTTQNADHLLRLDDEALADALQRGALSYAGAHLTMAQSALRNENLRRLACHQREAQRGLAQLKAISQSQERRDAILANARHHLRRILEGAPIPDAPLLCVVYCNGPSDALPSSSDSHPLLRGFSEERA